MLGFQIKTVYALLILEHRASKKDKGSLIRSTKMQNEGMNGSSIFMMLALNQNAHSSHSLLQSTEDRLTLNEEEKALIGLSCLKGCRKETEVRENVHKCCWKIHKT